MTKLKTSTNLVVCNVFPVCKVYLLFIFKKCFIILVVVVIVIINYMYTYYNILTITFIATSALNLQFPVFTAVF